MTRVRIPLPRGFFLPAALERPKANWLEEHYLSATRTLSYWSTLRLCNDVALPSPTTTGLLKARVRPPIRRGFALARPSAPRQHDRPVDHRLPVHARCVTSPRLRRHADGLRCQWTSAPNSNTINSSSPDANLNTVAPASAGPHDRGSGPFKAMPYGGARTAYCARTMFVIPDIENPQPLTNTDHQSTDLCIPEAARWVGRFQRRKTFAGFFAIQDLRPGNFSRLLHGVLNYPRRSQKPIGPSGLAFPPTKNWHTSC